MMLERQLRKRTFSRVLVPCRYIQEIFRLQETERMHDQNTEKFLECIKTSHDVCGENNLIAIKVTALIRPSVLKKFNTLLKSAENRSSLPPLFEFINRESSNEKLGASSESSPLQNQVKQCPP